MLQFITHKAGGYDELSGAEAVLKGGCEWVQLRMKDASDEEFLAVGRKLAELCRSFGARLIGASLELRPTVSKTSPRLPPGVPTI